MKRHLLVALMPLVGAHSRDVKEARQTGTNLRQQAQNAASAESDTAAFHKTILERHLKDDENDEGNNGEADNDDAYAAGGQAVNDDAIKYYEYNDDGYNAWMNAEYGDGEAYDATNNNDDTSSSSSAGYWYANSKNATQQLKSTVSSTAWEFYDTPPHEWTASQWNLVFGLSLGFFTLCCFTAACCAYRFVIAVDDDDGETTMYDDEGYPLSPKKSEQWSPRRPGDELSPQSTLPPPTSPVARVFAAARHYRSERRKRNKRNNRKKNPRVFDEDHYRRYQEEVEDDDGVILEKTVPVMHVEGDDDDEMTEATSVITKDSCYEAPRMTTSLAEYTSVQREKEARILEAVREEELRKFKAMRDQEAGEEESHKEDTSAKVSKKVAYDAERDWSTSETATTAQKKNDLRVYTNDDWKEDAYDDRGIKKKQCQPKQQQQQPRNRLDMTSSQELNIVLRPPVKEDKLLEARERKHNFVGYYYL